MEQLNIRGGKPLFGSLAIHGAKNSVLPILAASLLGAGVSVIHNCPALSDVDAAVSILVYLGCTVTRCGTDIIVDSSALCRTDIPDPLMREMRSSVIFLGSILARCGQAELSYPGGCELGSRPIDLHLTALRQLGAVIHEEGGLLRCEGHMKGRVLSLSIPSVGATENIMLAACGAEGTTILSNAAREPEIVDLQHFLNAMGADIQGAGSSSIIIHGGKALHGCEHTVISDRIVAATHLCACAACGGEVSVTGIDPQWLLPVTEALMSGGCQVQTQPNAVLLRCDRPLSGVHSVRTAPYPAFPTDAQPMLMAAFCRGQGVTVFVETIFDNRFRQAAELLRLGADIRTEGRVAVVCGKPVLHGASLEAGDLRGGAALVIGALCAEGESTVTGLQHLDRGYAALTQELSSLGADIRRISS